MRLRLVSRPSRRGGMDLKRGRRVDPVETAGGALKRTTVAASTRDEINKVNWWHTATGAPPFSACHFYIESLPCKWSRLVYSLTVHDPQLWHCHHSLGDALGTPHSITINWSPRSRTTTLGPHCFLPLPNVPTTAWARIVIK